MKKYLIILLLIAPLMVFAQPLMLLNPTVVPVSSGFTDITNGLVAWYPLAGDVNDHFGSFNGTAVGSPSYTTGVNGAATTAISLDGSSQRISISSPWLTSGNITMSAWCYRTGSNPSDSYDPVCLGLNSGGTRSSLYFTENGTPKLSAIEFNTGTFSGLDSSATSSIAINTWHLVVVTVNTSSGATTIFVDGVGTSGTLNVGFPTGVNTSAIGVQIFADGTFEEFWQGKLAGVRIYNRVLNSTETGTGAGSLYNNGINGNIF